jgi:uncharacterized protein (DUF1330 family)
MSFFMTCLQIDAVIGVVETMIFGCRSTVPRRAGNCRNLYRPAWFDRGRISGETGPGRRTTRRQPWERAMPAFIVFSKLRTKDQAELDTYTKKAGASFAGHDFKVLAAYGPQETLEGGNTEGTVILSFPTRDAAKAWFDSPAYTEARQHRMAGADYQVTLVEGV